MTRISTIHGIGQDEYAGRGAMVTQQPYIPYLSLTKGEMELYLAAQQARILAQWYGSDAPQYGEALTMIDNALHAGVHRGINWVGAVPDYLQNVARMIRQAERQNQPASRALFYRPGGAMNGIGQIIPIDQRKAECIKQANKLKNANDLIKAIKKCDQQFAIEKIFNDRIEGTGHHMLYHGIGQDNKMPETVKTKLLLQLSGVQGMAVAGSIDNSLMRGWVETGILSKNAQIGAGPIGSIRASVELSPDPALYLQRFTSAKSSKTRGDVINGIGAGPLAPLIIGAITAALKVAANLIDLLRQKQATIAAQGFGTEAFSGRPSDWDSQEVAGGISTTTLILLAAGAGMLLMNDDN